MYFTIEDLERHSLVIRTSQSVRAGATQIRVRSIPEGIVGEQIVIDVYGAHPETRTVTAQDTKYLTVAALAYGHAEDVAVVRMWLFNQAIVFNEAGADVDFRFEAVGENHALFIQGSDGFVGLGVAAPTVRLDVAGDVNVVGDVDVLGDVAFDGGAVFNESGADVDFRVEGSNDANLLFLDGGNDRTGIGTATPATKLHAYSTTGITLRVEGTDADSFAEADVRADSCTVYLRAYGTTEGGSSAGRVRSDWAELVTSGASGLLITTSQEVPIVFATTNVERMRIDGSGHVVFNEGGNDVDFRVESDTSPSALFVQGSDGFVGIGKVPTVQLDVVGNVEFDGAAVFNDSGADKDFRVEGVGKTYAIFVQGADGRIGLGTAAPSTELSLIGSMTIQEQAAAGGDMPGRGQLWVKTADPCELWFTDDAGLDKKIAFVA